MTTYRKKLIEVALPLKAINVASAREKSIRHGHPSTLHLWWARRPLAACRAVLFSSLVDDPDSDPAYRKPDGTVDVERAGLKRAELFNLIEELVQWENSNNSRVINQARAEIARCVASRKIELGELKKDTIVFDTSPMRERVGKPHPKGPVSGDGVTAWEVLLMKAQPEVVNAFLAEHAPPVLDPFCGGGSIPLEAQRLGLRAYASDLNPVPVLITKALIEIPPKFAGRPPVNPEWQQKSREEKAAIAWQGAAGLAEDVRYYGQWMRDEAEKRIGHLYPKVKITAAMAHDRPDLKQYVGQELTVIAWLWARTVASPNPAVKGAHTPLVRSFWLSTKKGKEAWARPVVDRESNSFLFVVEVAKPPADFDPGTGTVSRKGGRCILTSGPMPFPHIRAEGQAGRMQRRLMAIVAEGDRGRVYLSPQDEHIRVADSAEPTWRPDAQLPDNPRDFKTPNYGMRTFADLFTARQLVALTTFSDLVQEARERVLADARQAMGLGWMPAGEGSGGRSGGPAAVLSQKTTISAISGRKLLGGKVFQQVQPDSQNDSGASRNDSGASPNDSGASPDGSGASPIGLGNSPDVSGSPPHGSGASANDSRASPDGLGNSPDGSGSPPHGSRASPDASDAPLADGGSGPTAYADAVATYLAFAVDKSANYWSTLCGWHSGRDIIMSTFGRQALPMVWDYAEANPISDSSGNFVSGVDQASRMLAAAPCGAAGSSYQLDATASFAGRELPMISTDPPYYDNIGYADLSDFFYVWLRRSLGRVYPTLFSTLLTPKAQELIATPYRHDGSKEAAQRFFERRLGDAFGRIREHHRPEFPFTVFYAFKQSESDDEDRDEADALTTTASTGWETMLEGVARVGFSVTGTWPMRTELTGNLKKNVSALASSIVLVCRPRPADAPLATRKEFMNALRRELPEALKNLQHGNIAPVDLAQAAIGPGMAVFTRYAKTIETDGSPMTVRTALGIINQVLDEVLAEQEGEFDADTRWALAWFQEYGMNEGPFGVAETLSKAKNTAVGGLVEAGVVKARGGKVQLVARADLADGWDPATDRRLTVWETTQHLIRTLETKGESEAAALLNKLGGMAETARDLAYRLYSICERKKWADEALAYNGLVIAWPELTKLAMAAQSRTRETQRELI